MIGAYSGSYIPHVHMNGRIYDAQIARFVQADPIIQDPYKTQSLNRYSYVWNNPLNATDPSGFVKDCDESLSCSWGSNGTSPKFKKSGNLSLQSFTSEDVNSMPVTELIGLATEVRSGLSGNSFGSSAGLGDLLDREIGHLLPTELSSSGSTTDAAKSAEPVVNTNSDSFGSVWGNVNIEALRDKLEVEVDKMFTQALSGNANAITAEKISWANITENIISLFGLAATTANEAYRALNLRDVFVRIDMFGRKVWVPQSMNAGMKYVNQIKNIKIKAKGLSAASLGLTYLGLGFSINDFKNAMLAGDGFGMTKSSTDFIATGLFQWGGNYGKIGGGSYLATSLALKNDYAYDVLVGAPLDITWWLWHGEAGQLNSYVDYWSARF